MYLKMHLKMIHYRRALLTFFINGTSVCCYDWKRFVDGSFLSGWRCVVNISVCGDILGSFKVVVVEVVEDIETLWSFWNHNDIDFDLTLLFFLFVTFLIIW